MIFISAFFEIFHQSILETTWLEIVAVIFGMLSVWYAKKANLLVFPTGMVSVLIYVYICFQFQLYADMGINFFYFVMSVYGWYKWTRRNDQQQVIPIRWNTRKEQWLGIGSTVVFFWIILGVIYLFKHDDTDYIQSYVPWIDSFTTAIFLVGMLFMALKRVENWIYWIIGNIVSVPLYFAKGLVFTSFQYLVFLGLAIAGLIAWKRMVEKSKWENR